MSRGVGEIAFLQRLIPDWLVVPIALLTQLGDVWFLSLLLVSLYWSQTTERDILAATGGVTIAGLALLDTTKHLFALSRPDQPLLPSETLPGAIQTLYEITSFAPGYGFPSGHALMTTIVYLSLADILSISSRRRRVLAAWILIGIVGGSRIALGVHFLVDVVAGIVFGLLFLVVVRALLAPVNDQASVAFALGVLLAGINLVPSQADAVAILLFGASLGAFSGWQFFRLGQALQSEQDPLLVLQAQPLRLFGAATALVLSVVVPVVLGGGRFPAPLAQGELLGLGIAISIVFPLIRNLSAGFSVADQS